MARAGAWIVTLSSGSTEKRHPDKLDPDEVSAVADAPVDFNDFQKQPYAHKKAVARKCLERWAQMQK